MAWPTPQDYNEAVQNPWMAFTDLDLRTGQPELTALGLPRPISGNFACVYSIQARGQRWAARCFISEVSDQQRRYEAISTYLAKAALRYTVPFTYMPRGIKVQGKAYPLVKMQWVQGESLDAFVERSIGYPDTLLSLAKVWSIMMGDLKALNVAHGDLQHGNVLVVGDQLRLIDYDGMFVPALSGEQSNECGHRNYQLPSRTGWDYGPHLDNFSAWVIYVSLIALAVHPELWAAHRGGDECLLFRKEDFVQPETSQLLCDLNSSPNTQLHFLVELFTSLFNLSPHDVPSLDGNLTTITVEPSTGFNAAQSNSNWWSDHVELPRRSEAEKPLGLDRTSEAGVSAPDPTWIVESLIDDKTVEPMAFKGKIKQARIMILGSLALVVLTRLLIEMPGSEFLVVASCVFGLNLLICYIRYKYDPALAELEVLRKESKAFVRLIREHQTLLDSLASEQLLIQEQLDRAGREIAEEKTRLVANLQAALNKAQAELHSYVQMLHQRRIEIASSETTKLNSIQEAIGNNILNTDRNIAGLNQKEAEEKARALNDLQDFHVQSCLRGHSITDDWIPGIGAEFKARLVDSGFATAADIDGTVGSVHGIGPARQAALLRWRRGLEYEARRSAPDLSPQERLSIETKYRQERQTLEANKKRLQTQFNSHIASVRQYFAEARLSINQEEQQLRAGNAEKTVGWQREHDAELATLDQNAAAAKSQAAPAMKELSEKMRNAQKQIFALRWQCAKREKENRRFASLRFRSYLQKLISA